MKTQVIDVRTPAEYAAGNVEGSINIPLNEVLEQEEKIMSFEKVIFCCKSGARSGQATNYFKTKGLNCKNGGGWEELDS